LSRHAKRVPELPYVPGKRAGVFTLAEALEAGWTPKSLRTAVRKGVLDRLRPGVFRAGHEEAADEYARIRDDLLVSGIATVLMNPGAVVSHATAAIAHGLPVWRLPDRPCVTVPPRFTGEISDAHLHRATTPVEHFAAHGVPATGVERTVIDVGREEGVLAALVTADAALHLRLTTIELLREQLRDCRGWPGVRAAREAIELADGRAESPLETASRYRLIDRVPTPELQASIYDLDGRFLGRSDFLWDELGVVGEADGKDKFDRRLVSPYEEHRRQGLFEDCGLVVARWGSTDLADVDALAQRLSGRFDLARRLNQPRRWIARLQPRFPASPLHL
jgi:hypothetical protein